MLYLRPWSHLQWLGSRQVGWRLEEAVELEVLWLWQRPWCHQQWLGSRLVAWRLAVQDYLEEYLAEQQQREEWLDPCLRRPWSHLSALLPLVGWRLGLG